MIWKDVKGYEGLYKVSNTGEVKTLERKVLCFTNGCIIRVRNKKTPGVINQYAPGEFYAVTESDIWLMRYHKNILFAVNCKTTRKNKFEIKVFIFGN